MPPCFPASFLKRRVAPGPAAMAVLLALFLASAARGESGAFFRLQAPALFTANEASAGTGNETSRLTNEDAYGFRRLPEIENQLYGHAYPNQSVSARIVRIEKTLFGGWQRGAMEPRMQRIEAQMSARKNQEKLSDQEPMLEYLEEKLFQTTYRDKPLEERIRQLEVQVFGRAFNSYPVSVRLKKLTYAMPLMAKGIRLTKGHAENEMVIASTRRATSQLTSRSGPPRTEVLQLDALAGSRNALPKGQAVSTGDYFQAIHRNSNGSMMRWADLPIRVYVKPSAQDGITAQALRAWQASFSVEPAESAAAADIIVSWERSDWDQNTAGLITRPIVHMGNRQNIRTVVYVQMFPLRNQPAASQLHAMIHQFGHAFGLWGHSDDPDDIMYPSLPSERNDFPAKWGWRSASAGADGSFNGTPEPESHPGPSQRDINTLLKVYHLPASDLSTYNPY